MLQNKLNSVFCTLVSDGSDSCQGDSGGPVFKQENSMWVIYGVISFGKGCGGDNGRPAANVNVQFYSQWIGDIIGKPTG